MLDKISGILSFFWLLGLILSFNFSGSVHTLLVIASMLFLITAGIFVQINKRPVIKYQRKKIDKSGNTE